MKVTAIYKHINPFMDENLSTIKRTPDISECLKQDLLCDLAKEATPEGYYLQKLVHPEYTLDFNEQGIIIEK